MEKYDSNFLNELLNEPTPVSGEMEGTKIWDSYMESLGLKHDYQDKIGNSGWSIGCGPKKILISAHIDEICMSVIDISDKGYLTMISLGGVDPKVLPGSSVIILGNKNTKIKGIVCKAPIHSEYQDKKQDEVLKLKDLRISVGADSKEDVEKLGISIGSLAVLSRNVDVNFGEKKILGNALDDKIGVYIVSQIARKIKEQSEIELRHDYTFTFLAGTQEEAGLRGLTVAAHNLNPDISIDIDVTPAQDGECGVNKSTWGNIELGRGCVIEYGPDKSRRIADIMKDYAKTREIPFQLSVGRAGGTNTDTIQLSSLDCETMLVSIPNINMHTQNEVCDWEDVEAAVNLISGIIIENLL